MWAAVVVVVAAACAAPSPSAPGAATPTPSSVPVVGEDAAGAPAPQPSSDATATPGANDGDAPDGGAPDDTTEHPAAPVPTVVSAVRAPDGAVEVSGLVPGLVEDGGTCTAVVTVAGTTYEAAVPALADVASTTCGTVRVTAPAGPASARLAYRDAAGTTSTSAALEVTS